MALLFLPLLAFVRPACYHKDRHTHVQALLCGYTKRMGQAGPARAVIVGSSGSSWSASGTAWTRAGCADIRRWSGSSMILRMSLPRRRWWARRCGSMSPYCAAGSGLPVACRMRGRVCGSCPTARWERWPSRTVQNLWTWPYLDNHQTACPHLDNSVYIRIPALPGGIPSKKGYVAPAIHASIS